MLSLLKSLFSSQPKVDLASVIHQGALLVDVRSPAEFASGHVKGSVNIPLSEVAKRVKEFKKRSPVIVFCQSGNRSSQAITILKKNGITDVYNGGGWANVNRLVKNN